MEIEEILACYMAISAAYHAEPDRKKALEVYNTDYEILLKASDIKRDDFGYLLAHGQLPEAAEATE